MHFVNMDTEICQIFFVNIDTTINWQSVERDWKFPV